jgi:diadenylate cyclase
LWSYITNELGASFMEFTVWDAVDILLVSVFIYQLLKLTKSTRANQVLKGVALVLLADWLSGMMRLQTINFILNSILAAGAVVLVVLFQPELRAALERLGRSRIFDGVKGHHEWGRDMNWIPNEITRAVFNMSKNKIGALLVFVQKTSIGEIIASGTPVDGLISSQLIENIFVPNTPLHDGATVIIGDRIVASGCFLPLTDNPSLPQETGTRHRAAIGVTEVSDAVTIVVSEETGQVSVAKDGALRRGLDSNALREILWGLYGSEPKPSRLRNLIKKGRKKDA